MRSTVPSPAFATHTNRLPTNTSTGSAPTPIGAPTTVGEARSMRVTVPSPEPTTQTSCGPIDTPSGLEPTLIIAVATCGGPSWTRRALLLSVLVTHATP